MTRIDILFYEPPPLRRVRVKQWRGTTRRKAMWVAAAIAAGITVGYIMTLNIR